MTGNATSKASHGVSARSASGEPVSLPRGSHVVVVGAGFAGIGASERLIEAGYKVTQLEARDRIGGRAHTRQMGNFSADIGANWLRLSDNALLGYASENGLLGKRTNLNDAAVVRDGARSQVNAAVAYKLLERPLVGTYLWYRTRRFFGMRPQVASVQSLIGNVLSAAGADGCGVETLLKINYAADLEQLSGVVLLEEDTGSDDMNEPTVQGGMAALANALIDRAEPQLNERVLVISRTADGVLIKTDKREIGADAVIVTVSIGVLDPRGRRAGTRP